MANPKTSSYSEAGSGDTSLSNFPVLNKTGTFTGTISNSGDDDYFVVDIKGGSNDWAGSASKNTDFFVTVHLDNDNNGGSVGLQYRLVNYSYLQQFGPYGKDQFFLAPNDSLAVLKASDWAADSSQAGGSSGDWVLAFQIAPYGYTGSYTVHLRASDGGSGSGDSAPVAESGSVSGDEDDPISGQVSATDKDGDPLSFALKTPVQGLDFRSDGSFTFDPSRLNDLAPGQKSTITFQFSANDGQLSSKIVNETITVQGRDDAPDASDDELTLSRMNDKPITISAATLIKNDSDPDKGDTLKIISVDDSQTQLGSVYYDGKGKITFTPSSDWREQGFSNPRTDEFNYTVEDRYGETSTATVNLNLLTPGEVDGADGAVGVDGATGGNGGSVSLNNAIDPHIEDALANYYQWAQGGQGGDSEGGRGGNGGKAVSTFSGSNSLTPLEGDITAVGGNGGEGFTGAAEVGIASGAGGSAQAAFTMKGSFDGNGITANATGGYGGGQSRVGGAAGSATATAVGTTDSSSETHVAANAYGGHGGDSPSGNGGIGGAATATANGTETNGDAAALHVTPNAYGGSGGDGQNADETSRGHKAGVGGAAKATFSGKSIAATVSSNARSFAAQSYPIANLSFEPVAEGGSGGRGFFGVNGANGGSASVTSGSISIATGNSISINARSKGGDGGSSDFGLGGSGGNASTALKISGLTNCDVNSETQAGLGGSGSVSGTDGTASSTIALAGSLSNSNLSVSSDATGGAKATSTISVTGNQIAARTYSGVTAANGLATAKTTGIGLTGTVEAAAGKSFDSTPVLGIGADAQGVLDGGSTVANGKQTITPSTSTVYAQVSPGSAAPTFNTTYQAVAQAIAYPTTSVVSTIKKQNPTIANALSAANGYFVSGELGGAYDSKGVGTSETVTSNVTALLNLRDYRGELILGLYNGKAIGSGLKSLTFDVTATGGGNRVVDVLGGPKTFTTINDALTYFHDHPVDLGTIDTATDNDGTYAARFKISMSETFSGPGGFYANFVLADPPATSTAPATSEAPVQRSAPAAHHPPQHAIAPSPASSLNNLIQAMATMSSSPLASASSNAFGNAPQPVETGLAIAYRAHG